MVLIVRVSDGLDHLWRSPLLIGRTYLMSELSIYVYSSGEIVMLGIDGMDSSTQVPAGRCVWVLVAMSCRDRH
jgi:hypothetical protein